MAKKGIWVSEYRLESGLNCGGHAFATDGYLMGPILKEFNQNKHELKEALLPLITDALADSKHLVDANKLNVQLTVQGGVGTSKEHEFLLNTEQAHSVGWGSPSFWFQKRFLSMINRYNYLPTLKKKIIT